MSMGVARQTGASGFLAITAIPSGSRIDRVNAVAGNQAPTNGKRLPSILGRGEQLATATKQRRRTAEVAGGKNGSTPRDAAEFAAGSLETELSAIGKAVPAREWARVPADYFANLDHYLHGAPKKK